MPDRPDPIEEVIEQLLRLQRVANTVHAGGARVRGLFDRIVARLRGVDPTEPGRKLYQRQRTERFIEDVQGLVAEYQYAEVRDLKDLLAQAGRAEAVRAERLLIATLGEPGKVRRTPITQGRLRTILNSQPFEGRLLKEHVASIGVQAATRVRDQVRIGMQLEESIPDLVRRIRGRRVGERYVGGVMEASTRQAEALARTAVNFVSNEGLKATYAENQRLLKGVQFVAVLDDRTSLICASLDGTVWPADSPEVRTPPLHYNCRSVLVPVVDWAGLGLEPPPEPTRAARDLSGVSASDLERKVSARRRTGDLGRAIQVPSRVTAESWLKRQPVRVQERMLGRTRAKLFRDGRVSLARLVREDGTVIPLELLGAE